MTPQNIELSKPSGIAAFKWLPHDSLNRWGPWIGCVCIGLAGILFPERFDVPGCAALMPLAFGLSMSAAVVWDFFVARQPVECKCVIGNHARVRSISRIIYLILYATAAAKQIQYLCQAGGGNFPRAMDELRPYLACALIALVLARALQALIKYRLAAMHRLLRAS